MLHALNLIGWNVLVSVAMGVAVWLLCRMDILRSRPALCHGLWLLVLVKLITPSFIPVPLLPAIADPPSSEASLAETQVAIVGGEWNDISPINGATFPSEIGPAERAMMASEATAVETPVSAPPDDAVREAHPLNWQAMLVALLSASLCATVSAWLLAVHQIRRVRRLLRGHSVAAGRLLDLLQDVSRQFGIHSTPALAVVDASITPMLWAEPAHATIVLPKQLADTLDDDQLRCILAHELAHLVRRDHWTNVFAFFVTSLFWWNPIAWIARQETRIAAEACCDARALARLSGSRKSYARTLLQVVDFGATCPTLRPSWGITFGGSRSLRRRFEMLANSNIRTDVSRAGWLLLAILATTLALLPARAQFAAPVADKNAVGKPANADPAEGAATQKYYVTGVVFETGTRNPIAGVTVRILVDEERGPEKRLRQGVTGADGRYRVEVPVGEVRIWFPTMKGGYWLDPQNDRATVVTTPDKPVVTHDIAARPGLAWPVRVVVEGGVPDGAELFAQVTEIKDDVLRQKRMKGESVSFYESPNSFYTTLENDGTGAIVQCGDSGKFVLGIGGKKLWGVSAELLLEPGFDPRRVKTITPIANSDRVSMTDEQGRKATIEKAEVTLQDGQPLLTFRLKREALSQLQQILGQVVDAEGKPLDGVRVGSAIGQVGGGSGDTGEFATTDSEGRFELKLPIYETKRDQLLSLIVTKEGYASFDARDVKLPKQAANPIQARRLVLKPGHSVRIRVVDADGKALAGAVVEPSGDYAHRRQLIRTDEQGRGVLKNLPAGMNRVFARYGSLSLEDQIFLEGKNEANAEITLVLRSTDERMAALATEAGPFPDPPPEGAAAPELSIVEWTDGNTRKLGDYRGKIVVLEFWGVWCSSCIHGVPAMQELKTKYAGRDDVVFLGVHSAGGDLALIKKLQQSKEWNLVTGLDVGAKTVDGATARAYGASGWPTTVIVDRAGKIAYNSNLEKWNVFTAAAEMSRIAKAMKLPPADPDAPVEEQIARMNAMNVFQHSELIDRALERK